MRRKLISTVVCAESLGGIENDVLERSSSFEMREGGHSRRAAGKEAGNRGRRW